MKEIKLEVLWEHAGRDYFKLLLIIPGTDAHKEIGNIFKTQMTSHWIAVCSATIPINKEFMDKEFMDFEDAQDWVEKVLGVEGE